MRVPFDPPPGLVSNDTTYSVPGAVVSVNNQRPRDGRWETIGGWTHSQITTLTGICRAMLAWTNLSGVVNVAFGTHSKLLVDVSGDFADITPVGLAAGAIDSTAGGPGYGTGTYGTGTYSTPTSAFILRTWSLDTWGETLLGVPSGGTLYQWSNVLATPAAAIANAPDNITCMLVTPERQVLALGCNEEVSNDFNGLCIRGCDIEDLTDWTTSPDNNAFEHILPGQGEIRAAKMVGPRVAVWTDVALHEGQFLGNPDQTYRFDRVEENCGVAGPNAVTVLNGVAYWLGKDRRFRLWMPGTRPNILPCPIWSEFSENIHLGQIFKTGAVTNSRFNEVWFFYPDSRDGSEVSRYVAFAVTPEGPHWFQGEVARTAAIDGGILNYPLAADVSGNVYFHEYGSMADEADLPWSLRSAAQYLDEAERWLQVQRVRPDFKSQDNSISLTAYIRKHPQGSVSTKGPWTLAVNAEKKDIRFSAPITELEFEGTGFARFGKPTFDAVVTGAQ